MLSPIQQSLALRLKRPESLHPHLHDVTCKGITSDSGKSLVSYNSATPSESDANTLPLFPKTSSVAENASESAASPAAGNASALVQANAVLVDAIGAEIRTNSVPGKRAGVR